MAAQAREMSALAKPGSPFDLTDEAAYRRWREHKLGGYPARLEDLVVQVNDPRRLTPAERRAILERCAKTNMAIYTSSVRGEDKNIPRLLGLQFGLRRLDCNYLADEDGITQVMVSSVGDRPNYIPYTNRPIKWHTDGYYNPPGRRIWAMLLHCVASAPVGGENALMDHEIAYLAMRDANPDFVRALMAPDAMTIPPRVDDEGVARAQQVGPVFHVDPHGGALHVRYTARTRSIEWKQDAVTRAAVAFLEDLLSAGSPHVFRTRLEPGMGIVSNNVLHDRAGFQDDENRRRLFYRARYYDRIHDTASA
jgi:hypothetical protein